MLPLNEPVALNEAFAAALLDPEAPPPAGLISVRGGRIEKRFAVYRNNVTVGLIDALADIFPSVQRLVGEDYFRAMARLYVLSDPPRSPLIFEYGQGFGDFIAQFEPARHLGFLADVARLERLWLDAFHAADAAPLEPSALAAIPPEQLEAVRLVPHPATQLVRSPFAVVSIVARDRSGLGLEGLRPDRPETGLITRPACDVELRHLPPGGHAFISALCKGLPLGEAATVAIGEAPDADLSALIGGILASGAFISIDA